MHREKERIQRAGAELVFIGNGNRHQAADFKHQFSLDEPIYVDTALDSYRALAFKRSVGGTVLSPKAWGHGLRALKSGFRQQGVKGDAWQLGGVLIVRPGGVVLYEYRSNEAGDHPPVNEVLEALPHQTAARA